MAISLLFVVHPLSLRYHIISFPYISVYVCIVYIMILLRSYRLNRRPDDPRKRMELRSEANDEDLRDELLRGSLRAIITGTHEHIRRRLGIILQVLQETAV